METSCEICRKDKICSRCYTCKGPGNSTFSLCGACDDQVHRSANGGHQRVMLCSECEEENAYGYCADCEQYMCMVCSKSIHNKGARARHVLDHQYLLEQGYTDNPVIIQRKVPQIESSQQLQDPQSIEGCKETEYGEIKQGKQVQPNQISVMIKSV